jgi:hypothetical protein
VGLSYALTWFVASLADVVTAELSNDDSFVLTFVDGSSVQISWDLPALKSPSTLHTVLMAASAISQPGAQDAKAIAETLKQRQAGFVLSSQTARQADGQMTAAMTGFCKEISEIHASHNCRANSGIGSKRLPPPTLIEVVR